MREVGHVDFVFGADGALDCPACVQSEAQVHFKIIANCLLQLFVVVILYYLFIDPQPRHYLQETDQAQFRNERIAFVFPISLKFFALFGIGIKVFQLFVSGIFEASILVVNLIFLLLGECSVGQ